MPTRWSFFAYSDKGYFNPIECQRTLPHNSNPTLKSGAATERNGEGLDVLASNFDLLPSAFFVKVVPLSALVHREDITTRRYPLQLECPLFVGCVLITRAEAGLSRRFKGHPRALGRAVRANDPPSDLHSLYAQHGNISMHLVSRSHRYHFCLPHLPCAGVVRRSV